MDTQLIEKLSARRAEELGIGAPWALAWSLDVEFPMGQTDFLYQVIVFNQPMLAVNDERIFEEVTNHEFAHVLVGPLAEHGPVWQSAARALGCTLSVETGMLDSHELRFPDGYEPACPICGGH